MRSPLIFQGLQDCIGRQKAQQRRGKRACNGGCHSSAGNEARTKPKRSTCYGKRSEYGAAEKQGQSGPEPHAVLRHGGIEFATVRETIWYTAGKSREPGIAERQPEGLRLKQ